MNIKEPHAATRDDILNQRGTEKEIIKIIQLINEGKDFQLGF